MNSRRTVSPMTLLASSLGLQIAGLLVLAASSTYLAIFVGVTLFAGGSGLATLARPYLVSVSYGVDRAGVMNGMFARWQQLARAGGPVTAAALAGAVGYGVVFAVFAAAISAVTVFLLTSSRSSRMRTMVMLSVCLLVASAAAQEGAVTLPGAYKIQFENEWVKVTRVHYAPLEKLAAHAHTPRPTAYVYLNDGGPVRFKHIGGHNTVATRLATKAGAFRVYRGLEEIHEVENTSEAPSDFLRVELKTEPLSQDTFRGKFERGPATGDGTIEQVQFDHPQVSISRVRVAPRGRLVVAGAPSLLIALIPGASTTLGQQQWLAEGSRRDLENDGTAAIEWLRIQFKTKPPKS